MRKSKFSETQIVAIMNEAESGVALADLLRKHVEQGDLLQMAQPDGGASVSDVRRRRELEAENAKLKRIYADWRIENATMTRCAEPESGEAVLGATGGRGTGPQPSIIDSARLSCSEGLTRAMTRS